MSTNINDYITKTNSTPWKALKEEGVDTSGILVKVYFYAYYTFADVKKAAVPLGG